MEFPSTDVDRATRFWNGVMGWNFGSSLFEKYDYRMAQIASDAAVAVCPAVEQGPNVYLETPDLEAALERVKELGGAVGEIRTVPDPMRLSSRRRRFMVASRAAKTARGTCSTCGSATRRLDPGGEDRGLTRINSIHGSPRSRGR